MTPKWRSALRVCAVCLILFTWVVGHRARAAPIETTITFDEPIMTEIGFTGNFNQFLISSDGFYRVESFWLGGGSGMFHIIDGMQWNSNFSAFAGFSQQLYMGLRITKLDGSAFDLKSMDLWGQAAVGQINDPNSFVLIQGPTDMDMIPETIDFGGQFDGVHEISIVDPGVVGPDGDAGNSGPGNPWNNRWDNLVLEMNMGVPEPGAMTLALAGGGVLLLCARRRRQRGGNR